jgi:hypothetical protein
VSTERATAAGIAFVDLFPIYRQACDQASPEGCEGYKNLLFADVWMNPNGLGHRMAMEQMLQAWKSLDIGKQ